MIKVKSGKKMEQIPAVLGEWTARKLYCVPGVSIKSLSTQIGINSNYLSFYFNHVLGANFHQWLYTLRIEEAKRIILRNPGVKISEVASAVGIPIIYNFSRWFKSITGMTAVIWPVVPSSAISTTKFPTLTSSLNDRSRRRQPRLRPVSHY